MASCIGNNIDAHENDAHEHGNAMKALDGVRCVRVHIAATRLCHWSTMQFGRYLAKFSLFVPLRGLLIALLICNVGPIRVAGAVILLLEIIKVGMWGCLLFYF